VLAIYFLGGGGVKIGIGNNQVCFGESFLMYYRRNTANDE
jgi:hypothetical protein